MAAPKRLPKSKEERDFDKLMRDRRPSVWEDKGSVGDDHFRSLKGAAKLQQGLPGGMLPPIAGAGVGDPAAADRPHGAATDGAALDAAVAAQRAPRPNGCVSDLRAPRQPAVALPRMHACGGPGIFVALDTGSWPQEWWRGAGGLTPSVPFNACCAGLQGGL